MEEETQLFVGDLSRLITEDDLRALFMPFGEIVFIEVKRDKVTHFNLGFGFVEFRTNAQAIQALRACNGAEVGNRRIRISWAQKNTTLLVSQVCETVTYDQLRSAFLPFGALVEEDSFLGERGVYYVRYSKRSDAEAAKQCLNNCLLGRMQLRIGWADKVVQKHCVYLQFNPNQAFHRSISEEMLLHVFSQFGPVVTVSLPRSLSTKRLKGYAFVHYSNNKEGEQCASFAIQSVSATGYIDKIQVRCSFGRRQGKVKQQIGGGANFDQEADDDGVNDVDWGDEPKLSPSLTFDNAGFSADAPVHSHDSNDAPVASAHKRSASVAQIPADLSFSSFLFGSDSAAHQQQRSHLSHDGARNPPKMPSVPNYPHQGIHHNRSFSTPIFALDNPTPRRSAGDISSYLSQMSVSGGSHYGSYSNGPPRQNHHPTSAPGFQHQLRLQQRGILQPYGHYRSTSLGQASSFSSSQPWGDHPQTQMHSSRKPVHTAPPAGYSYVTNGPASVYAPLSSSFASPAVPVQITVVLPPQSPSNSSHGNSNRPGRVAAHSRVASNAPVLSAEVLSRQSTEITPGVGEVTPVELPTEPGLAEVEGESFAPSNVKQDSVQWQSIIAASAQLRQLIDAEHPSIVSSTGHHSSIQMSGVDVGVADGTRQNW